MFILLPLYLVGMWGVFSYTSPYIKQVEKERIKDLQPLKPSEVKKYIHIISTMMNLSSKETSLLLSIGDRFLFL
jgi:hypothetical protein